MIKVTFGVGLGKVMGDARADKDVALAGSGYEALAFDDRDLLTAAPDQPRTLQLCGGVRRAVDDASVLVAERRVIGVLSLVASTTQTLTREQVLILGECECAQAHY